MAVALANQVKVISLESRGSVELPLSDLMIDGRLEVYPHVEKKGLLYLSFRRSRVSLSAGPYIGLIPLTPRITVEVRPKMPVSNLARVLDAARGSLGSISGMDRLYLSSEHAGNSVLEFLAANLVDSLREIGIHGLHKEYARRSGVTSAPSGRIQMAETLRSCWTRGQNHRVAIQRFDQTSDIPVNRVIKAALQLVLQRLRPGTPQASELIRRVNRVYVDLPEIVRPMRDSDFDVCRDTAAGRLLPSIRDYYYRPLEIALLILSNRGVSLEMRGEDVLLETFIVNFETLFEEYLRRVLQLGAPFGTVVRDGNKEGRKSLFEDTREHLAQPDIVVWSRPANRRVIVEVKYKDKPSRDDINQSVTYAVSYGTGRAVLVHQNRVGAKKGLRHIGTVNGVTIDAYAFDLANVEMEEEERTFVSTVAEMVA